MREKEEVDIDKVSKKHADIWQTKWNLSLNDDQYERFKKYGFNPFLSNKSFTDSKGIYEKSVSSLTAEEKKEHDKKDGTYRSPQKIQRSLDSVSKYFKMAYDIFEGLNDSGEIFVVEPTPTEDEIETVLDIPQVTVTTTKTPAADIEWYDSATYQSKKDTIVPNMFDRGVEIKKGETVPSYLRNDDL